MVGSGRAWPHGNRLTAHQSIEIEQRSLPSMRATNARNARNQCAHWAEHRDGSHKPMLYNERKALRSDGFTGLITANVLILIAFHMERHHQLGLAERATPASMMVPSVARSLRFACLDVRSSLHPRLESLESSQNAIKPNASIHWPQAGSTAHAAWP